MTPHNLPQHWQWVRLEDIISPKKHSLKRGPFGSSLKKDFFVSEGIRVFEQYNPINQDSKWKRYFISQEKYEELESFTAQAGDLLVSCSGTLGKILELPQDTEKGIINQALLKITLDNAKILNSFFIHIFNSPTFQNLILEKTLGTAIKNIAGVKELKKLPIPLPPLEIQREIVEILESKLEKIASAKAILESSLKKCETYRLSLLNDAFNGNLTPHSKVWQWVRLGECLEKMTTAKLDKDTFSYIDIESIDNKTQTITTPKTLPTSKAPSRAKREVKEGDTLFSMVRPYLKNIAFVDSEFSHCVASTGFYVCRPKSNLLPKYLFFLMISPLVVNGLNQFMRGDNSPSIRSHDLENFSIPLPPLEIQREIVEILESKLEKIASAKAILESSLKECETYRLSLLESAFEGKLV